MSKLGILLVLLLSAGLAAGQPSGGSAILLDAIREKARANLERMPDFICLQTIERSRKDPHSAELREVDRLQVEVGLIGDREVFAWPDSGAFGEQHLADLIQHGTAGTGNFALHARNVLVADGPAYSYQGEEEIGGRLVHRFDYTVSRERSTYSLRVPPFQARVAFHGTFWADSETLDLVRLRVVADEIPAELGLVEAVDTMEYGRREIGSGGFLLPNASRLDMLSITGGLRRNESAFSLCRQYVGESSISFDSSGAGAEDESAAGTELRLPPRASLDVTLAEAIDPGQAVLGSRIRGTLAKPLKHGEEIVAPKGANVLGRLVRLEKHDRPVDHYVVGLQFDTLEVGGQSATFTATMREASGSSALMKEAKSLDPTFRKRRKGFLQVLVNETQRGQGVLYWTADRPVIEAGIRMRWEVEPER